MTLLYPFLALLAGLLLAVQGPVNTALGKRTDRYLATLVSFSGGWLVLALIVALFGNGNLSGITAARLWQLLGGLYGAFGVCVSIAAIPLLGVALTLMVSLLGQLITAVLIDVFGLLGQCPLPISPLRLAGILAVAAGIWLLYAANSAQQSAAAGKRPRTALMVLLVFLSGVGGAVQSPTNASLAGMIGQWESTFISFTTGTLAILLVVLCTGKGKIKPLRGVGVRFWMLGGGLFGLTAIFLNLYTVVKLGAALQVASGLLGQLLAGVVIDSFGLIETPRKRISPLRAAGIVAVTLGVALVTLAKLI